MKDVSQQAEKKQAEEKAVREKPHFLAEARELRMMMSPIASSAAEMIRADRDSR